MDDKSYRTAVKEIFERIERAFENVDPDVAEAESLSGTCTILTPANRSKIIVSPQPPVKQIWVAVAAMGLAMHFSQDPTSQRWLDDKDSSKELFSQLSAAVKATTGLEIKI